MSDILCESCAYYDFDEQSSEYVCGAYFDEDEYVRFLNSPKCPNYRPYDEYGVVRKQN